MAAVIYVGKWLGARKANGPGYTERLKSLELIPRAIMGQGEGQIIRFTVEKNNRRNIGKLGVCVLESIKDGQMQKI